MSINEENRTNDEDTTRNDNNTKTNEDMKFVPFFDYINVNNQQSANEDSINFNLQEVHKCLDLILKSDISNMPFIPNPYYMMRIKKCNNIKSTDENQRQHSSFQHDHNDHGFHPDNDFHHDYHYNFYPNFYPYPTQNFYSNYNIPPYYYPNQYPINGINPLALLLFSSLHR